MKLTKNLYISFIKFLTMSIVFVLAMQSSLAAKLVLIEESTVTVDEVATIELRSADELKKVIARYRLKSPFACPRDGFTQKEKEQAVTQAKDCITRLQKSSSELNLKNGSKSASWIIDENLYKAVSQCAQVIGALGSLKDVDWMNKHVPGDARSFTNAQIYMRHDVSFGKIIKEHPLILQSVPLLNSCWMG